MALSVMDKGSYQAAIRSKEVASKQEVGKGAPYLISNSATLPLLCIT